MLSSIDWTRPWYASIRQAAEKAVAQSDLLIAFNQQSATLSLTNHRQLPLRFVEQTKLPEGVAYEAFISDTGNVPTRNNLHDFFNALVWLSFPNIKRQLNTLQAAQIERAGIGKSRGPARDVATIFDENCALLVVNSNAQGRALVEALRKHQWQSLFIEQRDIFSNQAEVWLFGHALMEKLTTPYKSITAHTWVVAAPDEYFLMTHNVRREWLDVQVASELQGRDPNGLSTACFTPLPVLGVPGWWHLQDREFYDDATVFRPKHGGQ